MSITFTVAQATQRLEAYCAYQERSHDEVVAKLRSMKMIDQAIEQIVIHLLDKNFLNEERFARTFARGKHRIKHWGNVRITHELKQRNVSSRNIATALREIPEEEYLQNFTQTANRHWQTLSGPNTLQKRKKFCDYLLRKGFESHLVYQKARELEKGIIGD